MTLPGIPPRRVLLGQTGSGGDVLYATTLARQIKTDWPDCHLTWAVGSMHRGLIANNPDVDRIWTLPLPDRKSSDLLWETFAPEAQRLLDRGEYDLAIMSQIYPSNYHRFDSTVRPSALRAYPGSITVPVIPVLRPLSEETAKVQAFLDRHGIMDRRHRVMMECNAYSGQSYVTPDWAVGVAERVLARQPDTVFVLSMPEKIATPDPRIIIANELTLAENYDLVDAMTLFCGALSGISVVALCERARTIPTIQFINSGTSVYASQEVDLLYWGLPTDHLVECLNASPDHAADLIETALIDGMAVARPRFHEIMPLHFGFFIHCLRTYLANQGRIVDSARAIQLAADRFGWHMDLINFSVNEIMPNLNRDPFIGSPHNASFLEAFLDGLGAAVGRP